MTARYLPTVCGNVAFVGPTKVIVYPLRHAQDLLADLRRQSFHDWADEVEAALPKAPDLVDAVAYLRGRIDQLCPTEEQP